MSVYVLKNCKVAIGSRDFSSDFNQITVTDEYEVLPKTVFGNDSVRRVCGLEDWRVEGGGLSDMADDAQDEVMRGLVGVADTLVTVCHTTGADGELCNFGKATLAQYQWGGAHGQLAVFSVTAHASGSILIPATVMKSSLTGTATTGNGNGTAYNLGAVGATQSVYGALHVTTASAGDTLDVIVESDTLEAFGSPTTQLTFTQAAAVTSEMKSKAGPIAGEIWWRVSWTVGGVDPSFRFICSVGIK